MTIVERAYVKQDHGEECGISGFGARHRIISLGNGPDKSEIASEIRIYTDYPENGGKLKRTVAAEYSGSLKTCLEGKSNKGVPYTCLDCGIDGIRYTIATKRCKPCQAEHERELRRQKIDKRATDRKEYIAKVRKDLKIPCTHNFRQLCDFCRDKIMAFRESNRKKVDNA